MSEPPSEPIEAGVSAIPTEQTGSVPPPRWDPLTLSSIPPVEKATAGAKEVMVGCSYRKNGCTVMNCWPFRARPKATERFAAAPAEVAGGKAGEVQRAECWSPSERIVPGKVPKRQASSVPRGIRERTSTWCEWDGVSGV